ncbi:MAG TPA: hypothetical protein VLG49_04825 [Rhabdochlamydiaceae bacterium]|nr:hypothetical protein [Rhabdochlamydiaceae bacterium]
MNKMPRLLYLCAAFLLGSSLFAAEAEMDENDIQVLREWINTKRQVTVKELGGALSISGEVRTEFQRSREKRNGKEQRGTRSNCQLPNQAFDVEVNLMVDYRQDRTWAAVKWEFDNDAGAISGTFNRLKLERAYFGLRAIAADTCTVDVEIGRRRIGTILDSKLEFDSFFDGIFLKYDQHLEMIGDAYVHVGVFLVDEHHNHYAYLGEIGVLNAGNTGFYSKYSLIDWDTKHYRKSFKEDRFEFLVSQLIVGYRFQPSRWTKGAIVYLAGLYNHAARKLPITGHRRANFGGYLGFTLGELKKRNDWSLDANYQVLAAQCVPDFDVSGVGLGNACKSGFYFNRVKQANGKEKDEATDRRTAGGNVNFRGYAISLDYLLTNNLDIQQSWQQAITLWDTIGPFRRFHQYELELIYAF